MEHIVKAVDANLLELLHKSEQFIVPVYQRLYSWGREECEQLWKDIVRAGNVSADSPAEHFTGSIVYVEADEGMITRREPNLIIDGQQRVTTVMLLLTALAFFLQLPVFVRFLDATGTDLTGFFHRFTTTGYLVTVVCLLAALGLGATLLWRFSVFSKGRDMMRNLWAGIVSLRGVKNLPLYLFYSVAIWVAYYLHFYIAFFCFDFTSSIDPIAAFLIFCVGSFAVLVPTPNGAGPWHFAVKTMLVLYGVAEAPAVMFALVVHTIQTALVVLLGAYAVADLTLMRRKGGKTHSPHIKNEQL